MTVKVHEDEHYYVCHDGRELHHIRTEEKVYKEFMLYALGRNLNKYHRFPHGEIKKFEGKTEEKAA